MVTALCMTSSLSHKVLQVCSYTDLLCKKNIFASMNKRGLFLLELEERLKSAIDKGITIWLEPVGDKSKLRQLRGIKFN